MGPSPRLVLRHWSIRERSAIISPGTGPSSVRLHLKPTIGDIPVTKLSPENIQRMHRELEADEIKPRHRQIIHSVLSKALDYAVLRRLIDINPIKLTPRPRAGKPEIKALTPEQATRFLEAIKGKAHEALLVVAVTTALRQGELFGLQWADVDLDRGTIIVRRTMQRIYGKVHLSEPKTAKDRRKVPLPELARNALLAHKPKNVAGDQWVFPDTDGGPLRKENLVRRHFLKRLADAGLPTITFHGLRHTAATLLLHLGEHPKIVQELLGHAEVTTTLDIYSHYQESMGRKAASRLDEFFAKDA